MEPIITAGVSGVSEWTSCPEVNLHSSLHLLEDPLIIHIHMMSNHMTVRPSLCFSWFRS